RGRAGSSSEGALSPGTGGAVPAPPRAAARRRPSGTGWGSGWATRSRPRDRSRPRRSRPPARRSRCTCTPRAPGRSGRRSRARSPAGSRARGTSPRAAPPPPIFRPWGSRGGCPPPRRTSPPPPPGRACLAGDRAGRAVRAGFPGRSGSGCPGREGPECPPPRTSAGGRSRGRSPGSRGRRRARRGSPRAARWERTSRPLTQPQALALVTARLHRLAPGPVGEVPADGGEQAALEVVAGPPAQLLPDLGGVDRVASIVAGTVLHEGLEPGVAFQPAGEEGGVGGRGVDLVQDRAEPVHHLQVRALVAPADVVLLPGHALAQGQEDPLAVVL